MMLPDYWIQRPVMSLDDQACSDFDGLLERIRLAGPNHQIVYNLSFPKWQFLCHVADQHNMVLHGSGDGSIHLFEPRQAIDLNEFGGQTAVYAAGDGLWAMFFAIVDRDHYPMSVNNACIQLSDATGKVGGHRYVFSISQTALSLQPWRTGFVYLLPPDTFTAQASQPFGPYEVSVPQLASLEPVTPLARLEITPEDFPLLINIRGHEDARLQEYAQAMQNGGLWPEPSGTGGQRTGA
jgi:hypothetical protein